MRINENFEIQDMHNLFLCQFSEGRNFMKDFLQFTQLYKN